ncbi:MULTISPECIES: aspartate/glutamate racemase family protein [unclassified Aureimonas]|uniref:aspartate/glutamate racemase family protein n=1 Tax=unclassified Aureimonas TaxID=2615206 RepID=UPI000B027602|nr:MULTISPECIES: aspartate/glutamate racemase family protein [unclassified Aureimonas]
MRIAFVNPNATASMTAKVAEAARSAASPGTEILAFTNTDGPASIQGEADGEAATPGLLAILLREREAADAFVVACFDDTALAEARAVAGKPVLGIGEAAFLAAAENGRRFSVVTTLSISVPIIEANIAAYGLEPACLRVRASEVPVLALEEEGGAARETVAAEIGRALEEDRPDAIVLGCAGMADLADAFATRFGLPVIDGVFAAVRRLEAGHRPDAPGL